MSVVEDSIPQKHAASAPDSDDDDIIVPVTQAPKKKATKRPAKEAGLLDDDEEIESKKPKKEYTTALYAFIKAGSYLLKIIECIKDLLAETNFDCSADGINMQAMDSSHVSLVHLWLPKAFWNDYHCAKNLSLGINLMNMISFLKMGGSASSASIAADSDTDFYEIVKSNPKTKAGSTWQVKLMDIDSEHLGIPEVEYDMVVKMPSSEFKRICAELMIVGDEATVTGSAHELKFTGEGDKGKGHITCAPLKSEDAKELVSIEMFNCDQYTARFALRYLVEFAKVSALVDQVTLKFKDEAPLCVEFELIGLGFIRFYLAPKFSSEGELE